MLQPDKGKEEGERIAVGIDPCKEFLQLAILSPGRDVEFRKLPLLPSITEEIAKSTDPARTQIAIKFWAKRSGSSSGKPVNGERDFTWSSWEGKSGR